MKLIELHILQSFPVSCLNRDDLNSPKTATFGGVQRARVSSQCWKRQIRLACNDLDKDKFRGQRSRQFIAEITKRLTEGHGGEAEALANCISHYLGKLDLPKNPGKVKTIAYYSPGELDRFASVVSGLKAEDKAKLVTAIGELDQASLAKDDDADEPDDAEETEVETAPKKKAKGEKKMTAKTFAKLVSGIFKPALRKEFKDTPMVKDAADIALFGRMVAADHSLTLEGAAMFSHALSTHKVVNEIDFFTAVDDLNPADESGSGHMGTTEFNAATYYRYAAVNLTMLADEKHLGPLPEGKAWKAMTEEKRNALMTVEERKEVMTAFIRATLTAVPHARQNSMNAATLPAYVLGIVKERGQPIQLINAFEKPAFTSSKASLLESSIAGLKAEHTKLKETWCIELTEEVAMPDVNVNEFIARLIAHVL